VLALDCANRAFELDVRAPGVKSWTRPRREFDAVLESHTFYFVKGQWYYHHTDGFTEAFSPLSRPGAGPNYARYSTREAARDWFLAAGMELPDELADLRPAKEPTPDLTRPAGPSTRGGTMSLPSSQPWPGSKRPLWHRMETALHDLLNVIEKRPNAPFKAENPFCRDLAAAVKQLAEVWIEAGLQRCTWEYGHWSQSRAGGCARSLLQEGCSLLGDCYVADTSPKAVAALLCEQDPASAACETIDPAFVDAVCVEIEQFAEILLNSTKPPATPMPYADQRAAVQDGFEAGFVMAVARQISQAAIRIHADAGSKPKGVTPKGNAATSKRKRIGGKRRLEQSNPLKLQVYHRIQAEHRPGEQHIETVKRLRGDANFVEQIKDAGLGKLDTKLVRRALACFDQRERAAARKNQETDPA
jgi:hypothetical protein